MAKKKKAVVAMKAGKFYYRAKADSAIGQKFEKYIKMQQDVDVAAADLAEQLGAETYIVRQDAIGGIQSVTFAEDKAPDPKVWQLLFDPKETEEEIKYFVPNVTTAGAFMTMAEAEKVQAACEKGEGLEEGMEQFCVVSKQKFFGTKENIERIRPKFEDMVRWTGVEVTQEDYRLLMHRRSMYNDPDKQKVGTFEFENPTDEQLNKARAEFIKILVEMCNVELHHVALHTGSKEAIDIFKRINALPVIPHFVLPRLIMAAPGAKVQPKESPVLFINKEKEYYYFAYGLPCNVPGREKVSKTEFYAELNRLIGPDNKE